MTSRYQIEYHDKTFMAVIEEGMLFFHDAANPQNLTCLSTHDIKSKSKQQGQDFHVKRSSNGSSQLVVRGNESTSVSPGHEEIAIALVEGIIQIDAHEAVYVHKCLTKMVEVEEADAKASGTKLNDVWEQVDYMKAVAKEWDLCIGDCGDVSMWREIDEAIVEKKEKFEDWEVLDDLEVIADVL